LRSSSILKVLIAGLLALGAIALPALAQAPDASDTPEAAQSDVAPRPIQPYRPRIAAPPAPAPPPPAPAAPTARLPIGAPIPPQELEALVDGAVHEAMSEDHIPGVTVSVVQNGQVVLKKGYGLASLDPARPVDPDQTLFRVGSISKLFTWIAVMKEVERGRMRLDGPINLYLPETLQVKDQGYANPVPVRDLMNHAPGFEDKALGRLFERKPSNVRPMAQYLRQEKPRRVLPPGALPEYSNYGAVLAGEAVSQVSGRPYDDLIEGEILRPLGMVHTTFREPYPADPNLPAPMPQALAAQASQGFRWTGAGYVAQPFEYISQGAPAGAASSTAGDMARLMTLILASGTLDGQTVYGPATAQAFRTLSLQSGPGIDGWASGFMVRRLEGGFVSYGHAGETLNFLSNLVTVPALNLGVFVSGNSQGAGDLAARLPGLIVSRFYAPPALPPAGSPDLAAQRRVYAGAYLSERRRYGGLEKFVSLFTKVIHIDVTPDGRLVAGGRAFTPTGTPGQFREIDGERMAGFQFVDGVAQRWRPPSGAETYTRLGRLDQPSTLGVVAAAALIAAAAVLLGAAMRDRRDFRQTGVQSQAGALQAATAVLWFIATGAFVVFALKAASDPSVVFYDWPGAWMLIASSCALVAALFSALQTLMLPAVWRGGRRVESWTGGRKFRFTFTTLLFLGFSALLGLWGALEPWSG
jgi:CubicO group peptidase (beta-lactamase class C family)